MTKTKAEVHARLGKIASRLRAEIQEMEPRERKLALKLAGEYSETNCWWVLYEMRGLIAKLIDDVGTCEELPKKPAKKVRKAKS